MMERIKWLWESTLRVVELGVSTIWLTASLVLIVLLFCGYQHDEFNLLTSICISLIGLLQWRWRMSVWPALRKHHSHHQ